MPMTAIEFENISKQYQLGNIGTGTLSRDLNRWWARIRGKEDPYLKIGQVNNRASKAESDFVWALRDINFKVEQGEVLGIIGKNGSGKSTLLKILSKVTSPTTGRIRGRGRVASLLEVGTGFHPEMTGRENIYMNGSIMGMTKAEIDRKLDEIVDFAGVQMYVDTPVKRYSSGMTVRLGFAIAAHLEPEILVVDEVLAVGDAEFQKKAIGKMQDVAKGEGRTVLFVSHNMAAVRSLCTRGIVLQNGLLVFDGTSKEAVETYTKQCNSVDINKIADAINQKMDFVDNLRIHFNGTEQPESIIYGNQETVELKIEGHTSVPIDASAKLIFKTLSGTPIMSFAEGRCTGELELLEGNFSYVRDICLPKFRAQGDYMIDICLHKPSVLDYFYAKDCAVVHVQNSDSINGLPLKLNNEGAFSLISQESTLL
ncbi:MAG: ABC transporter ATP-binding protein [Bacteroidaceae bacterium]|nr:ABC transporter ATP-binding protein [Bacteroidaceae bacterium]